MEPRHDPYSHLPPALSHHRNPGDAWVYNADGERFWGRFGAAGLLAVHPRKGVLLQHRAQWSHHGGTWGIPGGALHQDEAPLAGALREAQEEAGIAPRDVRPRASSQLDKEVWTYTTVIADASDTLEPRMMDAESIELRWTPVDEVGLMPLHPAFARSWPGLVEAVRTRPRIIVDLANVMGSVPDGWWRDRAAAASRWIAQITDAIPHGVAAQDLTLTGHRWFPQWTAVVEGKARQTAGTDQVEVVAAPSSGDDAVVQQVAESTARGERCWVVTSDRELQGRARDAGASALSAGWLLKVLGTPSSPPLHG